MALVVAGEDISDWQGVLTHRVLPDGRVIVVYERPYNTQITISEAHDWPDSWTDGW